MIISFIKIYGRFIIMIASFLIVWNLWDPVASKN